MSIKNNVATLILYVYSNVNSIKKTIHYAVNIISTEAKLFAIHYGINQVIQVSYIIVITNTIHLVKHIFDLLIYLYQLQLIVIA